MRVFSHIWKGALLPQFFDPLFYLVALGFGLGTYVAHINGVPYKDFVAPGLVASAVMWAASFETTWNVYFRMEEERLYDAILSTPVEVQDIVAGELLWAGTRAVVYGSFFLLVVAVFGLVDSWWALAIPPFLVLGGFCFGVLGLSFTSLVPRPDYYSFYFTLFVTPMFLFGGIFFPYDKLPQWAQVAAWFTPLYHLVSITRGLATTGASIAVLSNALWLAVLTLTLAFVPVHVMGRRLVT
jgi:lipooligosaccharide transport system permease protein